MASFTIRTLPYQLVQRVDSGSRRRIDAMTPVTTIVAPQVRASGENALIIAATRAPSDTVPGVFAAVPMPTMRITASVPSQVEPARMWTTSSGTASHASSLPIA
jgi:hypothetical protein